MTFAPRELGPSVAPSSVFSRKFKGLFFCVKSDHVEIILCRPPNKQAASHLMPELSFLLLLQHGSLICHPVFVFRVFCVFFPLQGSNPLPMTFFSLHKNP